MNMTIKNFLLAVILLIGVSVTGHAQSTPGTSKYPTALDDTVSLFSTSNRANSTLSGAITSGSTSLTLANAAMFPTSGAITIENEIIFYTGKSGNQLTGLIRGQDGTLASSHNSGVEVSGRIIARHVQVAYDAIRALQAKLGIGADTPAAGEVLKGGSGGSSSWAALSVTELSEYSGTSGSGSTAIRATITSPSAGQVLSWNGSNWVNDTVAGGGGGGDSVSVGGASTTDVNFVNTTATGTIAGVTWSLNTAPSPDEISISLSSASGSQAGVITNSTQTIGGNKTLTGITKLGSGTNENEGLWGGFGAAATLFQGADSSSGMVSSSETPVFSFQTWRTGGTQNNAVIGYPFAVYGTGQHDLYGVYSLVKWTPDMTGFPGSGVYNIHGARSVATGGPTNVPGTAIPHIYGHWIQGERTTLGVFTVGAQIDVNNLSGVDANPEGGVADTTTALAINTTSNAKNTNAMLIQGGFDGNANETAFSIGLKIAPDSVYRRILDFRMGTFQLEGTVTANGTTTVTGTGTDFDLEVQAGDWLKINGNYYEVASVTNDTTLVTTAAVPSVSNTTAVKSVNPMHLAPFGWLTSRNTADNADVKLIGLGIGSNGLDQVNIATGGQSVTMGTAARTVNTTYPLHVVASGVASALRFTTTSQNGSPGMALGPSSLTNAADTRLGFVGFGTSNGLDQDMVTNAMVAGFTSESHTGSGKGSYIKFETTKTGTSTRSETLRAAWDHVRLVAHSGATDSPELRLSDLDNSHYFAQRTPNTTATSRTLVWPDENPSVGEILKVTGFSSNIITTEWSADSGGPGGGDYEEAVSTKTTTYTILNTDRIILANPSGGTLTLNLDPAANFLSSGKTKPITIVNIDSTNDVTVDASGSETINGNLTAIIPPGQAITIVTDGTSWYIR